jgi:hypothetical protein
MQPKTHDVVVQIRAGRVRLRRQAHNLSHAYDAGLLKAKTKGLMAWLRDEALDDGL